jgi:hypothetical protein
MWTKMEQIYQTRTQEIQKIKQTKHRNHMIEKRSFQSYCVTEITYLLKLMWLNFSFFKQPKPRTVTIKKEEKYITDG